MPLRQSSRVKAIKIWFAAAYRCCKSWLVAAYSCCIRWFNAAIDWIVTVDRWMLHHEYLVRCIKVLSTISAGTALILLPFASKVVQLAMGAVVCGITAVYATIVLIRIRVAAMPRCTAQTIHALNEPSKGTYTRRYSTVADTPVLVELGHSAFHRHSGYPKHKRARLYSDWQKIDEEFFTLVDDQQKTSIGMTCVFPLRASKAEIYLNGDISEFALRDPIDLIHDGGDRYYVYIQAVCLLGKHYQKAVNELFRSLAQSIANQIPDTRLPFVLLADGMGHVAERLGLSPMENDNSDGFGIYALDSSTCPKTLSRNAKSLIRYIKTEIEGRSASLTPPPPASSVVVNGISSLSSPAPTHHTSPAIVSAPQRE